MSGHTMLQRSIDAAVLDKASVLIGVLANKLSSGPAREAKALADHLQDMRQRIMTAKPDTSPDLLAALKYARARLGTCARTHGSDDEAVDALLEPINAAIAAAEGERG